MATEQDGGRAEDIDFRAVFEQSPDAILVHDADGGITMANQRAEAILGMEASELAGRQFDDAAFGLRSVDGEPLPRSDVPFARVKATGESITAQQVVVDTPDGERVLSVSGAPLWEDGAFDGAVMSVQDATSEFETKTRIREQNEQLETVMAHLPVVLFALDPDGTFTLSKGRGLESLGLEPGELDGSSVFDVYADYPGIIDAVERALDGEKIRLTQEVGELAFDTQYRPVVGDNGEVKQIIGVSLDVTERRRYERRLEANDAILTQLTGTTDDVFWMFDGDFSDVEFVNDAYEEVWGRSVEAVQEDPMDFMQGVHPDDRAMVAEAVERLRAGESTDHEYRVNPGEEYGRWVWVRGEPIFDDEGNVERIAGFARDITDRKERERELERSERQFDAVFNDPQLLVALLETDGTVQRVNETAVEYAGADNASMTGDPFAETPWWSHDEALQERLQSWLHQAANGEYVEYEAEHPLPGGGEMNAKGTIRPVTDDDGTVRSLIASARDVTERVERERELEESNKRLEQFAYVASHDLQEPLRTISNFVELIEDEYGDELDEEADRLIDVVVTGSERMQSMIDGLLDYSRVTTRGKEFEPVDTDAVAAGVVDDLTVKLNEESGSVHWEDLPTVEADGDQLRQLFQNLVKNALEHSEGPVDIEIRATETPDSYRFEVEDDGPGIDPSRHEKIFRIFKSGKQYQTSSQAKGIGLAICDNIVQRHGGELWVESNPGEGATFGFTIDTDQ
jgi:PAS domain S-box-containing protein